MKRYVYVIFSSLILILGLGYWVHAADQNPVSESKNVWNTSWSTGTDLFPTPLTPTIRAGTSLQSYDCTYRCMIALTGASSVVTLHVTRISDGTTQDFQINGGTALSAGVAYNFSFNADAAFKYNFRVNTSTTCGIFTADRSGNN